MWVIQTTKLFRSDREVISNPYLSVYFNKYGILARYSRSLTTTNYIGLESFILAINLEANVFSILISMFEYNILLF